MRVCLWSPALCSPPRDSGDDIELASCAQGACLPGRASSCSCEFLADGEKSHWGGQGGGGPGASSAFGRPYPAGDKGREPEASAQVLTLASAARRCPPLLKTLTLPSRCAQATRQMCPAWCSQRCCHHRVRAPRPGQGLPGGAAGPRPAGELPADAGILPHRRHR